MSRSFADALDCAMQTSPMSSRGYIFAALLLCFVGDVLLLFPELFVGGLVAFLLGHVAFIALFSTRSFDLGRFFAYGFAPQVAFFFWVRSWLFPKTGKLHGPVLAYLGVINAMVGCAIAGGHGPISVTAAVLFLLSDVGVARDKFIGYSLLNRSTLLIYFAAVLLFAYLLGDPEL